MKILVTGAAGFIGQHVCHELIEAGHTAITLDRPWYMYKNQTDSMDIMADITEPLDPIDGLDAVVHLAAVASPRECDENPSRAFDVNVNGTYQVLKMALESGAKKFIFSSTAHVYGSPAAMLPTSTEAPLRPGGVYATTKILGERLCELYYQAHELRFIALRLFNAYGPGQPAGYFVPDMIAKAQMGSFSMQGGATTKDFIHINDVAKAFRRAAEVPFVGPINIGSGVETPLGEVALQIGRGFALGGTSIDMDLANATRMLCDYARAERVLGWTPTIDIKEGLEDVITAAKR